MLVQVLLGINIFIGLVTIVGVGLSIYKTHILTFNHISHLSKDVKDISEKVDEIDKTSIAQSVAIAGIKSTCTERRKQIDNLTK